MKSRIAILFQALGLLVAHYAEASTAALRLLTSTDAANPFVAIVKATPEDKLAVQQMKYEFFTNRKIYKCVLLDMPDLGGFYFFTDKASNHARVLTGSVDGVKELVRGEDRLTLTSTNVEEFISLLLNWCQPGSYDINAGSDADNQHRFTIPSMSFGGNPTSKTTVLPGGNIVSTQLRRQRRDLIVVMVTISNSINLNIDEVVRFTDIFAPRGPRD